MCSDDFMALFIVFCLMLIILAPQYSCSVSSFPLAHQLTLSIPMAYFVPSEPLWPLPLHTLTKRGDGSSLFSGTFKFDFIHL